MDEPDRDAVTALDRKRKALRQELASDLDSARHNLHPKTIAQRWTNRQKARVQAATAIAEQKVAKNAPVIGLAGLGILLFSLRKPISRLIGKARSTSPRDDKDQMQ